MALCSVLSRVSRLGGRTRRRPRHLPHQQQLAGTKRRHRRSGNPPSSWRMTATDRSGTLADVAASMPLKTTSLPLMTLLQKRKTSSSPSTTRTSPSSNYWQVTKPSTGHSNTTRRTSTRKNKSNRRQDQEPSSSAHSHSQAPSTRSFKGRAIPQ